MTRNLLRLIGTGFCCFILTQSYGQTKGKEPRFISGIQIQTMGANTGNKSLLSSVKSLKINNTTPTELCDKLLFKYAQLIDVEVEKLGDKSLLEYLEKWANENGLNDHYRASRVEAFGFAGLVLQDVYQLGTPESLEEQLNSMSKVHEKDLQFGDVIFLGKKGKPKHSAIYLADGNIATLNDKHELNVNQLSEKSMRKYFITGCRPSESGVTH
jgi:hypothetical protein